jgi:hypothetical protein
MNLLDRLLGLIRLNAAGDSQQDERPDHEEGQEPSRREPDSRSGYGVRGAFGYAGRGHHGPGHTGQGPHPH